MPPSLSRRMASSVYAALAPLLLRCRALRFFRKPAAQEGEDGSGKVAYAIMSFGGFLGVGERYHPLPWNTLKYDTRQGGYVVGLTRQQNEGAPTFARTETPAWGDPAYEKSIHDYYGAAPYWGR
jgi:hypothetical protein